MDIRDNSVPLAQATGIFLLKNGKYVTIGL